MHLPGQAESTPIVTQLDTGATCDVMTMGALSKIEKGTKAELAQTNARLRFYDGTAVHVEGMRGQSQTTTAGKV